MRCYTQRKAQPNTQHLVQATHLKRPQRFLEARSPASHTPGLPAPRGPAGVGQGLSPGPSGAPKHRKPNVQKLTGQGRDAVLPQAYVMLGETGSPGPCIPACPLVNSEKRCPTPAPEHGQRDDGEKEGDGASSQHPPSALCPIDPAVSKLHKGLEHRKLKVSCTLQTQK